MPHVGLPSPARVSSDAGAAQAHPTGALSPRERRGLWLLLAVIVAFGAIVEMRSAFLVQRRTDLEVYLRAAWAVRTGADIYAISDQHDWHYLYPPLFAILMVPLADAPAGAARTAMLPFAASVAIWYALNLLFLAAAVHLLAGAVEETALARAAPRWCRRWWQLRVFPILACLPAIGSTLGRSEVNLLILLLLCAAAAAAMRGRGLRAGLWLAFAISIKVIPALLLAYPLWRRNFRMLAGCACGLVLGLVLIPAAVFGPVRALSYYREWSAVMMEPALASGTDQSRAKELLGANSTDSQSFQIIIHNTLHLHDTLNLDRGDRTTYLEPSVRAAHWAIGLLMVAITLFAAGANSSFDPLAELVALGSLIVVMILLSPVCHLHYFTLGLPLMMGFVAVAWGSGDGITIGRGWATLMTVNAAGCGLPLLPGLNVLKDLGLAMYTSLAAWVTGVSVLRERRRASETTAARSHSSVAGFAPHQP